MLTLAAGPRACAAQLPQGSVEGVIVAHFKRPRRGRARGGSEDALFERALLGDASSSEGRRFDPRQDRKTLQLCRQVQRALSMALGGECADELLREVYVESVEPMGSPGQLRVNVVLPGHVQGAAPEVWARLAELTSRLRAAVAREICRKRVPNLSFIVMPSVAPEDRQEGGGHGR
jgi:ribosome-binding factor A